MQQLDDMVALLDNSINGLAKCIVCSEDNALVLCDSCFEKLIALNKKISIILQTYNDMKSLQPNRVDFQRL